MSQRNSLWKGYKSKSSMTYMMISWK